MKTEQQNTLVVAGDNVSTAFYSWGERRQKYQQFDILFVTHQKEMWKQKECEISNQLKS